MSTPDDSSLSSGRSQPDDLSKASMETQHGLFIHPSSDTSGWAWDVEPIVRVTLIRDEQESLEFPPVSFELQKNGRSVVIQGAPRDDVDNWKGSVRYEDKDIIIANPTVMRDGHVEIWCDEAQRVFIRDNGSINETKLNDYPLVPDPAGKQKPYYVRPGDILQLGSTESGNPSSCFRANVDIEYLRKFRCMPGCACPMSTFLDRKMIFSKSLMMMGAEAIYNAIMKYWREEEDPWISWSKEEAEMMIGVIDDIMSEFTVPGGFEIAQCRSWIRKIVRQTNIIPPSFIMSGVVKTSEHPVSGGGFADVYMGKYENKVVAVKVLRVFDPNDSSLAERVHGQVVREALHWRHLEHPHILPFLGISEEVFPPRWSLVSPWMPNGDILTYLRKNPTEDRLRLVTECASGLQYLHSRSPPLVHGDIKGLNILIDRDRSVQLTDFGLLSITETTAFATAATSQIEKGSTRWMAPELFESGAKRSRSADVYAFGMTVLEIYTGRPPFHGYHNDVQVILAAREGRRPETPGGDKMQNGIWNLASACWQHDKVKRPEMESVLKQLRTLSFVQEQWEIWNQHKKDPPSGSEAST